MVRYITYAPQTTHNARVPWGLFFQHGAVHGYSNPMKRLLAASSALALVTAAAPAMAGGLSSGVKNAYFNNHSYETITHGTRDITIDTTSDVTWNGSSESYKSFCDTMGSLGGLEYSSQASGSVTDGPGRGNNDTETSDYSSSFSIEDPKFQLTFSSGWTSSSLHASGTDHTTTSAEIHETYNGYSESSEHGHEATSFASSF